MQEHVREANDRVERRAQFVADRSKETALGNFYRACLLPRLIQFFPQNGVFGSVADQNAHRVRVLVRTNNLDLKRPVIHTAGHRWHADAARASRSFAAVACCSHSTHEANTVCDVDAVEKTRAKKQVRIKLEQIRGL